MRPLLLLCLLAICAAAESEVLTLKDGRKLTGVYDAQTGILDMGMAKIPIALADIDSRKPAAPEPAKAAEPAKDAALLGDPKTMTPEERAKKLAILRNLLERTKAQAQPAAAILATRQTELQAAQADRDLRAVQDGLPARQAAANEGAVKCKAMYPKADSKLVREWRDRFEAQEMSRQKTRQAAAERKVANAVAAVKVASGTVDRTAADSAALAERIAAMETSEAAKGSSPTAQTP